MLKQLHKYETVHVYELPNGYITWRVGTGDNVEILHIHSDVSRNGIGRKLLQGMVERLADNPPYATVFGFTRSVNYESQLFYQKMGFDLSNVKGVYADGSAIVFSQDFKKLKEGLNGTRNH